MRAPAGFWEQTVTTPLLCERYRLLSERRRLVLELGQLEARMARVSPGDARLWAGKREALSDRLCPRPHRATLDVLRRDVRALASLVVGASRRWVALGAP
jgi:hypothetical protein